MADDFQIFTSLRYDPVLLEVPTSTLSGLALSGWNREHSSPFYLLDYHRDRMLQAAVHWGWEDAVKYEILVDSSKTTWSDHSHFKTTKRIAYDAARQRARINLPDLKEVLIVDEADGAVMEGSTTTPYFWREGGWVTPAVKEYHANQGSGGQNGTSRRWALERCVNFSIDTEGTANRA
ncbi:hypothetical protein N0V88_002464 [Collariella sp. IMI 366227]|nr:hypothetical protein N0V88_002464 [Collariella sp. IMI 366227]